MTYPGKEYDMQDPQPKVEYDDLGRYVDIHDYVYEEKDED